MPHKFTSGTRINDGGLVDHTLNQSTNIGLNAMNSNLQGVIMKPIGSIVTIVVSNIAKVTLESSTKQVVIDFANMVEFEEFNFREIGKAETFIRDVTAFMSLPKCSKQRLVEIELEEEGEGNRVIVLLIR